MKDWVNNFKQITVFYQAQLILDLIPLPTAMAKKV